jgi:hypothetical protein
MKESEIRPQSIFDEYLRLARIDAKKYFADVKTDDISCPACQRQGTQSFIKDGFTYKHCDFCFTLFVSPRPEWGAFVRYYTESEASKYWATTFYKETAQSRKEKLWVPKAHLVKNIIDRYNNLNSTVVDIGGGYGLFAESMREIYSTECVIIEPSPSLAKVCRDKEFQVVEKFLEDVSENDMNRNRKRLLVLSCLNTYTIQKSFCYH